VSFRGFRKSEIDLLVELFLLWIVLRVFGCDP